MYKNSKKISEELENRRRKFLYKNIVNKLVNDKSSNHHQSVIPAEAGI
jgi:hypothetical protein